MIPYPKYFKDSRDDVLIQKEKCSESCLLTCSEEESWIATEIQEAFWGNGVNIDLLKCYDIENNPIKKEVVIIAGTYSFNIISKFIKKDEIDNLPPQGYIIKFVKFKKIDIVLIAGKDAEGLSYGCVSFTELLSFEGDLISVKKSEIRDWPDFQRRGIQRFIFTFDKPSDSRYYEIGTPDWKAIIDLLHRLKMNTIVIHNECWVGPDSIIPINGVKPKYREIIRSTIDYAHKKNIKVFMTLAHGMEVGGVRKIVNAHPCASEEKTQDLWQKAFEKIVEYYPGIDGYNIHINEGMRCECEKCKEFPYSEEFITFINKYHKILKKKNTESTLSMVPYIGFSELMKMKKRVPRDIINFLWTDTNPRSNLPYCLEDPENYNEAKYLDCFDRTWYWMYMNGWVDETFHCPMHFKRCSEVAKGKMEALIGETGLYRGTMFNILALSQYSWDCSLEIDKFRRYAVEEIYGNSDGMYEIEKKYEEAIANFLKTIWINGKEWTSGKNGMLVKDLSDCKKLLNGIKDVPVDKAIKDSHRIFRKMLKLDIEILLIEIDVRLNIRRAYLAYKKRMRKDVLNILKDAYKLHKRYVVLKKERGNFVENMWSPNVIAGELIEKTILGIKNNSDSYFDRLNSIFKPWSVF